MTTEPIIVCDNVVKIYKLDEIEVVALQGLDLTVRQGEVMSLVGASGSGKTTLLNVLGGLDRISAGRVMVAGNDLLKLSEQQLDQYRRRYVGFVWQQKARNLIPYLDIQQNIELPMIMSGVGAKARRAWANELIDAVGLTHRRNHRLAQLSGGEQQRVAIAVALANRPALLLGDEPTGELDSATAETIFEIFHHLNRTYGLTVVIVSHDPNIARHVDRVVQIRDGKTSSETKRRAVDAGGGNGAAGDGGKEQHVFEELVMLDQAGRLQVPKEIREKYGIGNRIRMEETPEGLLLRPVDGVEEHQFRHLVEPDAPPEEKPKGIKKILSALQKRR
ncbi:MAG TPA: ATP-binding cassette domain-containing protein [Roseiflexaceae bacterium]|nr:ATP-binding cassette domain-containing protein [Roseiflexaceae bacterium]